MWRSRARLGLCAIVVALAWPAVPVAAVGAVAPADVGTLQVSPPSVQASTETPLTLSFTPANPSPAPALDVTLMMPSGWTAIPPSSSDFACPNSSCSLVGTSSTKFEIELSLRVATTLTLGVQATPPGYATSSTFTAIEQPVGLPFAPTFTVTVTAPPVTVTCPADGLGTMTVDPSSVPAATSMPFMFAYKAGSCGAGVGGIVTVTVPPGWTHPSTTPGTPGFVTWTGTPQVSVLGSTIVVPVGNLEPGTMIFFEYREAQAPGSYVPYAFAAGQAAAGESSQPLVSSPMVMVATASATAPATATATATPGSSPVTSTPSRSQAPPAPGIMRATPARVTASRPSALRFTYTAPAGLSSSGEVVVQVPAGWTAPSGRRGQAGYTSASGGLLTVSGRRITVTGVTLGRGRHLTITYAGTASGAAGVVTFLTWQRPDGAATLAALPVSPQVTVALAGATRGQPADALPILLVVIGLVLIAAMAGLAAFRPLRRGGHGTVGGDVRAVPRTGPPPSAAVRDTGNRPALTVRIEPRAGATVTTIEERQP